MSQQYKNDLLQLLGQIKDIDFDLHISGLEGVSSKALINLAEILEKNESSNQSSEDSSKESTESDTKNSATRSVTASKIKKPDRGTNEKNLDLNNINPGLLREWLKKHYKDEEELEDLRQELICLGIKSGNLSGKNPSCKARDLADRIVNRKLVKKFYTYLERIDLQLAILLKEYCEKNIDIGCEHHE